MAGIAYWLETHCRIMRFAATLSPERFLRVRAEDVLNDGGAQLSRDRGVAGPPSETSPPSRHDAPGGLALRQPRTGRLGDCRRQ